MKVVIGLGSTGLSCVKYLVSQGDSVIAMDEAAAPSAYPVLQRDFPQVTCVLGKIDRDILARADEIIISPGVPLTQPELVECRQSIIGDVELFARVVNKPVYAITGSNGKTTVTSLIGEMAQAAGRTIKTAGNIGTPVLDALADQHAEGYALELSSFQLESIYSLKPRAALILNVTPDHMDRYPDFQAYLAAKQRIYRGCDYAILNADAADIWQTLNLPKNCLSFSVQHPDADYHLHHSKDTVYLAKAGRELMDAREMPLNGLHHWQNALAALALGETMNLDMHAMLSVLRQFTGLAHRCQKILSHNGIAWYNDSKGTNIGASETAINTLGPQTEGKLILIAGGVGKGANFDELQPCVKQHVSDAILIGQDAPLLEWSLRSVCKTHHVDSLTQAVMLAKQLATAGDNVLLSPACASFDMFENYMDRGNQFIQNVEKLCKEK